MIVCRKSTRHRRSSMSVCQSGAPRDPNFLHDDPVSVQRGGRGDGEAAVSGSRPCVEDLAECGRLVAYATDPNRHLSVLFRPGWR